MRIEKAHYFAFCAPHRTGNTLTVHATQINPPGCAVKVGIVAVRGYATTVIEIALSKLFTGRRYCLRREENGLASVDRFRVVNASRIIYVGSAIVG